MKIAIAILALVTFAWVTPAASQGLPPNPQAQAAPAQPAPQPQVVVPQYEMLVPGWYSVPIPAAPVVATPVAPWEYYAWFNANYRATRGPIRRIFVGPYVRRSPFDPVRVSYYYR